MLTTERKASSKELKMFLMFPHLYWAEASQEENAIYLLPSEFHPPHTVFLNNRILTQLTVPEGALCLLTQSGSPLNQPSRNACSGQ